VAVAGGLAVVGVGVALRHTRLNLPARKVPMLGLAAAFVFAAQMINFPVLPLVSGHLMGGVLVAALLGPSAAVVVMAAVLIVQCFLLADGGVLALGANIFNMGIVGVVGGWAVYALVSRMVGGLFGRVLAATFAGWVATVLAAVSCTGMLVTAGKIGVSWGTMLPVMVGLHMLIGVFEGLITGMVLTFIARVRPEMWGLTSTPGSAGGLDGVDAAIQVSNPRQSRGLTGVVYGLVVCVGLALFVSPFKSEEPDGMEASIARLVEDEPEGEHLVKTPMDWLGDSRVATGVAGAVGTLLAFGFAWVVARGLVKPVAVGK